MGLIDWILVGAIAGMLAKRIVPGPDPGRFIVTVLLLYIYGLIAREPRGGDAK